MSDFGATNSGYDFVYYPMLILRNLMLYRYTQVNTIL